MKCLLYDTYKKNIIKKDTLEIRFLHKRKRGKVFYFLFYISGICIEEVCMKKKEQYCNIKRKQQK